MVNDGQWFLGLPNGQPPWRFRGEQGTVTNGIVFPGSYRFFRVVFSAVFLGFLREVRQMGEYPLGQRGLNLRELQIERLRK